MTLSSMIGDQCLNLSDHHHYHHDFDSHDHPCTMCYRCWCTQAWRTTAGDFQLSEQGVLAGEGDGQDERRMGACEYYIYWIVFLGIG